MEELIEKIRAKFAHVDECPISGKRIFFENAGGALTLNSVVATSTKFAAIPDNQGRENATSKQLVKIIEKARADAKLFFNVANKENSGEVFFGESGTELLFRIISSAAMNCENKNGKNGKNGNVISSTLEHPASRSAAKQWAAHAGLEHIEVPHNNETGTVAASDYEKYINENTCLATIIHTSPVTGMGVDIKSIATAIRQKNPACYIVVDGIQHAAHGGINIGETEIDAYVISPYKVFARHGYGLAWISNRLAKIPHNNLTGAPAEKWELGTRDTGAYATFSNVVEYLIWLGEHFAARENKQACIKAAGEFIKSQEKKLVDCFLHGIDNIKGLAQMQEVQIIGGVENKAREGLLAINIENIAAEKIVEKLNQKNIRTHTRKADYYSANILKPLNLQSCVRISLCHYNNIAEVKACLLAIQEIITEEIAETK